MTRPVAMKTALAMCAGVMLLAAAPSSEAQSKGYRPPPPPPPPPPRSASVPPAPSRPSTPPTSRLPQSTPSSPTAQVSKPSVPKSSTTGSRAQTSTDYAKLNSGELQKAIGSHTKQIESYRARVSNPRANYPNWDSLSRERQGALLRQWNEEIRRHEASRTTAQRVLSQKTR